MTRHRRTAGLPPPPPWIGRIGPGQRWRTREDFDRWVRAVWLAQPVEVRVAKVVAWCRDWHRNRRRARA